MKECERYGWNVVARYKDEGISGRSVAKRSGYLNMMADAEAGKFDIIVVTALDRLGRNARELHHAKNLMSDCNVSLFIANRGVLSGIEFAFFAEMAQGESERIAERVSRGQRAAAARGKVMGDTAYGYRSVVEPDGSTRVEVYQPHARVVLRINQDYAAGLSPVQIAAALTAEGIPMPQGKKVWSPNTILGTKRSGNGLIRNPRYVGRIVFGKTTAAYDWRTGTYKKRKADTADMITSDAPWLRILSDELWQQVQDRLSSRSTAPTHRNRPPDYLLSGLTKCGVCGGAFAMTTAKLGCVNHRVGACDNSRRVVREDLERGVLEGLRGRLALPHVVDWFLPEYLQEAEKAAREAEHMQSLRRTRADEVEREIANIMQQIRSGAGGYAVKLLNEQLDSLGREKERLAREGRSQVPLTPPALDKVAATARLHALLNDLEATLQGPERDAARARDIIRSFIDKITVTPIEPEGRPDGRGCGPVRVTIEGMIDTLVEHALLDRKTLPVRVAGDRQGLPTWEYRIYFDLDRRLSPEQEGVFADEATLARELEETDYPLHFRELVASLHGREQAPTPEQTEMLELRVKVAIRGLRRPGWVRSVGAGAEATWVWTERELSDEEWLGRLREKEKYPKPIGIVRIAPPSAFVTVVGPRRNE